MTKKGKTSPSVSRALFALTVFLTGFVFGYRLFTCKRQDFSLKSEQLFALFLLQPSILSSLLSIARNRWHYRLRITLKTA